MIDHEVYSPTLYLNQNALYCIISEFGDDGRSVITRLENGDLEPNIIGDLKRVEQNWTADLRELFGRREKV